jgi:LmbE family N-acetylglucosaminyl deacetylase
VLVCPDPLAVFFGDHYYNHRDHREVGFAALDAALEAAMPLYHPGAGAAHRVQAVYLSGTLEPSAWVDISSTVDLKADAVACHRSQLGETAEWLRTVVRERADEAGREAGVPYAESFRRLALG